jgi:thiol:disulfide interchange protein
MPFLAILQMILLCVLSQMNQSAFALSEKELLPPDQAFKVSAKAISADQLEISWKIADGYYLYRDKIQRHLFFRQEKPSTMKILAMWSFTVTICRYRSL